MRQIILRGDLLEAALFEAGLSPSAILLTSPRPGVALCLGLLGEVGDALVFMLALQRVLGESEVALRDEIVEAVRDTRGPDDEVVYWPGLTAAWLPGAMSL